MSQSSRPTTPGSAPARLPWTQRRRGSTSTSRRSRRGFIFRCSAFEGGQPLKRLPSALKGSLVKEAFPHPLHGKLDDHSLRQEPAADLQTDRLQNPAQLNSGVVSHESPGHPLENRLHVSHSRDGGGGTRACTLQDIPSRGSVVLGPTSDALTPTCCTSSRPSGYGH